MKKVIGIFLTMVLVVLMASMAFGEECDCSYCKADRWIHKWAEKNGYEECYNDTYDGDTHYRCGVMVRDVFEQDTGVEFSIYNWGNLCVDEYNCIEFTVETLQEGIRDVYCVRAETADSTFKYESEGITKVVIVFTVIDSQY